MMQALIRDTWRAVLVVVGGSLLLEVHGLQRQRPAPAPTPPPAVTTPTVTTYGGYPPAWQPQIIVQPQPQPPERPLRRVAQAVMELGDSMIGVVR